MFGATLDAYLATFCVSVVPNVLLILIPQSWIEETSKTRRFNIQHILLCFAAAGLLGDVFLHVSNEIITLHTHV